MGRKAQKKKPLLTEAIGPTPERLAKDYSEQVNPALIDSKQIPGTVIRLTQSTVDRWQANGLLDERQMVAINHCVNLWLAAGSQSFVQDLNKVIGAPGGMGTAQSEALAQLQDYKERIPSAYWSVFENVVRFDLSGGVAGSPFYADVGRASAAARLVVALVADLICDWNRF